MPILGGKRQWGKNVKTFASLAKEGASYLPTLNAGWKAARRLQRTVSAGGTLKSKKDTSTEDKFREGKIFNEGRGGQYTECVIKPKKGILGYKKEMALAPLSQIVNNAYQVKSLVGKQTAQTILTLGDINAYQEVASAGPKANRFILSKAIGEVTLSNIYLSNCVVTIYDCISRRDGISTFSTPSAAWGQGYTDIGAGNITNVGAVPWDTDQFNDYWKVVQRTEVTLGSGVMHRHRVNMSPHFLLKGAVADYYPVFRDITYCCMIVVRGAPANDTMTQSQVSIGVGGVNIVSAFEHIWRQMSNSLEGIVVTNNLLTAFTNAEQVVNEGTSVEGQAEG